MLTVYYKWWVMTCKSSFTHDQNSIVTELLNKTRIWSNPEYVKQNSKTTCYTALNNNIMWENIINILNCKKYTFSLIQTKSNLEKVKIIFLQLNQLGGELLRFNLLTNPLLVFENCILYYHKTTYLSNIEL